MPQSNMGTAKALYRGCPTKKGVLREGGEI